MTIRYECKECGARLNIKDELAGTHGHCPKCKAEFTVPAPDPADAGAGGAPAAAGTGAARSSSDGFDDDDIDRILSGDAAAAGTAVAGKGDDGGDSADDEYGVAAPSGGLDLEAEDAADDRKKSSARKKARTREEEERIADAASVARTLMGRADKADKAIAGAEPEKKRSRNPFGGADRDDDEEGFSTAEIVKYFLVKGAGPLIGIAVFCYGLYWIGSTMIGGPDLPPLGRVSGTVTLDGQPLSGAIVTFSPMSEEANKDVKASSSSAYTDPAGNFQLMYSADVSGAAVGKHFVTISAMDPQTGLERVPTIYSGATSTLSETVNSGSNVINFTLQSKPAGN